MAITTHRRRAAALLLLAGPLGCAAVISAPDGTHAAWMWPVGLTSGVLVLVARRDVPATGAGVFVVALASLALGGYPLLTSLGYAAAITLEGLVVLQLVRARFGHGRRLDEDADLVRFVFANAAGALVGAVLFGLVAALTDFGLGWQVALAVLPTHLASSLIAVTFFMDTVQRPVRRGRSLAQVARWTLTIGITVAALLPGSLPALVFLVLPVLAWTALRSPLRETLWQLVAVGVVAGSLTYVDRGPFAALDAVQGRSPELAVLPLQTLLLCGALISIPFAVVVSRDRRSAVQVAGERERLHRIVESVTAMAIIESDERGRITLFNPGAEALLGWSEDEVVGRLPDFLHTRADITRLAGELGVAPDLHDVFRALAEPDVGAQQLDYVCKDGRHRTMSLALARLRDETGRTVGFLGTMDDLTDRLQTQRSLESTLAAERRAVAQLTEIDRAKDAFVSSVSHELRTPIANIVGYLELLLDGAYGETTRVQHDALERIDGNSVRLLELVDDLLALSSVEAMDLDLNRAPVDLREVVRQCVDQLDPDLTRRGQRLDVQVPARPVVVLGDAGHLARMVVNLATNAVKFTPDGGTITLRLRVEGSGAAIEVQDTGVGIPEDEQSLLFNRFFRSSYAQREAIKGSGLGLTIARTIAERHGARISARSREGQGSVFTVTFHEQGNRSLQTW